MRLVYVSLMVLILGMAGVKAAEPEGAPNGASDAEPPLGEGPTSEVQPKNNVPPRYPATAKSRNLEGACKLRVFIDETGRPYEV
jgi:outer membrane biosynthesis protein TonB